MTTIKLTPPAKNNNTLNDDNTIKTTTIKETTTTKTIIKRSFLDKLPLNLIELIINFSLPNELIKNKTYNNFYKRRNKNLKNFCLINKLFFKLSKKLLLLYLYLNNPLNLNILLKLDLKQEELKEEFELELESNKEENFSNSIGLLNLTKSLKLGDANVDSSQNKNLFDKYFNLIHKLLIKLVKLEKLEIHNVENLDICMLSWGVGIKELTLDNVTFTQTKAQSYETDVVLWHLPNLTHLFIDSISYLNFDREYISTSYLLNRLSLPKLETLTYQYSDECSPPSFDSIAPYLKSLHLYRFIDQSNLPTPIVKSDALGVPLIPIQPVQLPGPPPPPIHYPSLPDLKELNNLEHLSLDFRFLNDIKKFQNLNCSPKTIRINSDHSDFTLNFIEKNDLFKDFNNGNGNDDATNTSSENGNGNETKEEEEEIHSSNNGSRVFSRLQLVIVPKIDKDKVKEGRLKTREFCERWGIDLKEVVYDSFDEGREIIQWMKMTGQY